jgi:CheY-like chemotaxis protein
MKSSAGRILIVDDSPNDVDLLLRTFHQLRVENPIEVCHGGQAALDYLKENAGTPPSLVLLDLKMPAVDGFQVLQKIKSHPTLRDLVVIVLTTSSDMYDVRLAYDLGANSFLTKPLDLDEFRAMVNAFHQYWIVYSKLATSRGKWMKPTEGGGTLDPSDN